MRILYACHQFFPEYYTGTERYTLDLARQMQKIGHEVMVLTYAFGPSDVGLRPSGIEGILVKEYAYEGIPVIAWRHKFWDSHLEVELQYRIKDSPLKNALRLFLLEHPFDIIHCTHLMRVTPIAELAKENEIPLVLHLTDFWMLCPRATLLRADKVLCEGPAEGTRCATYCYPHVWSQALVDRYLNALRYLNLADVIFSPTRFLVETFRKNGANTSRFVIRPYGFDYRRVKFRQRSRNSNTPITFGFISTLLPHKGAHIVIDAFRKVLSERVRLKIFGGYFTESDYYRTLVEKAGDDPRIEFCGEYDFDDAAGILEEIDVIIVASTWYENAPLVISLAQAFRIPVITTALGGLVEIVEPRKGLNTFEPENSDDLAAKICRIAENPSLLDELQGFVASPPRIENDALYLEGLYNALIQKEPIYVSSHEGPPYT